MATGALQEVPTDCREKTEAQELAGSEGANASGRVTGLAGWRQTAAKKDFTGLRG